MRFLILGYSKIAQKRILPALLEIKVAEIDVASRTRYNDVVLPKGAKGQVFENYDTALAQSDADLVYISTVNSTHGEWTRKSLEQGFHVIVDKPAFTSLEDTKRLVDLARHQKRCLAEATVYACHPQIQAAKDIFLEANSQPTRLTAVFSFPPLPPDNFRYRLDLGGGALFDLGCYAVTPGRLFFGEEPQEIFCRIIERGNEVETSFSIFSIYSGGRSLVGHFGFNTSYCNRLEILGPASTVTIDRIFTTSADMESEMHIRQFNGAKTVKIPTADSFAIFFSEVIHAIETGQHEQLGRILLSDALLLHRLRQATTRTSN